MERSLKATIKAVFFPAVLLLIVIAAVEYLSHLLGLSESTHIWFVITATAVAEMVLALFIFLSVRRLVAPMENKLNKFKQSIHALYGTVERSTMGIISFDRNGQITYVNRIARGILGIELSDTATFSLFDRLSESSREHLRQTMEQASTQGPADLEAEVLPAVDGAAVRIVSIHMIVREPISKTSKSVYSGIINDITEKKRIEREYAEAKEREKHLYQQRSEFLARISHEIRTPLHAVIHVASSLDRSSVAEHQKSSLERIELLSRHLLRTVNEFLDFTKLEADRISLEREPFHLANTLCNVMNTLEVLAEGKPVRLELQRDPAIPEWIVGDSYRLEQVLINLVGNAAKFTSEGSIRLAAELESISPQYAKVRFAVRDTGIGMTEEQLEHVFHPFQQAAVSISRQFGGSGLGLFISKRLVELMGGKLCAESDPGGGTEFYFRAYFERTNGPANSSFECRFDFGGQANADGHSSARRILLVEDDELILQAMRRMLENCGASVVAATRAAEALRILNLGAPFDLILMDMHMPEMDGIEAVRRIRAEPKWHSIPIVMLTADTVPERHALGYDAGVQQIVVKPIEPKQLQEVLSHWLGKTIDEHRLAPTFIDSWNGSIHIEGLDSHRALARLNGDHALYLHLLDRLGEKYGNVASQLEEVLRQGQRQEAVRIVHALRGASSLLAANGIRDIATRCEEAWSHEDAASPSSIQDDMLQELDRQIQRILDSVANYKQSISSS